LVSVGAYLTFQFALVMYGGTNLAVFVTYSLPIQVMVFVILLDHGDIRPWELPFVFLAVIVFNRLWMPIPLPDINLQQYLDFYGGYHMLVTTRTVTRIVELGGWMLLASLMRGLVFLASRRDRPGST
jgi:hypothetical protein